MQNKEQKSYILSVTYKIHVHEIALKARAWSKTQVNEYKTADKVIVFRCDASRMESLCEN
jgi:hypothetical protein